MRLLLALPVAQLGAEPICDPQQRLVSIPCRHERESYYYLKEIFHFQYPDSTLSA